MSKKVKREITFNDGKDYYRGLISFVTEGEGTKVYHFRRVFKNGVLLKYFPQRACDSFVHSSNCVKGKLICEQGEGCTLYIAKQQGGKNYQMAFAKSRRKSRRNSRRRSRHRSRNSRRRSRRKSRRRSRRSRRNSRHRDMSCNRPRKSWRPGKKRVVRACSNGKSKIIHFGATGYGHNYSPAARRSFRARHHCSSAKNKLSARYWACKNLWSKGGSKQRCPSNRKCKRSRSR